MLKHSSSGFTIAELGAGLGVFALAASLMVPMAVTSASNALSSDGGAIVTVAEVDADGRKIITTPPADAVEVTVTDASTGEEVKTVTVNDPDATSTVISGLAANGSYTFEVAKINAAGKSAKATAKVEYKKVGEDPENYQVTVPYTATEETTVSSTAEQVTDTSRPIKEWQENRSDPQYKTVTENYTVPVTRYRPKQESYTYPVTVTKTGYRTESYTYSVQRSRGWTHTHWSDHTHYSNHTHRSNHRHSYCHYHSRWYRCHRHGYNHTHSYNHRHGYNHRHSSYHTHYDYWTERKTGTRSVPYQYPATEYRTGTRTVQEPYTAYETRTRNKTVFSHYGKKLVTVGYHKKTQYRLCYRPRGFGGSLGAQVCSVSSSPQSKRLTWQVTKQRQETRTRMVARYGHVKQKMVKAPRNFVVFKTSGLSNARILSSGQVAAVGSGVSGVSAGDTKSFFRWSGKKFTFNGEQYVMVHRWALRG